MESKIGLVFSISGEFWISLTLYKKSVASFTYELFFLLSSWRKLFINADVQKEQQPTPLNMGLNIGVSLKVL